MDQLNEELVSQVGLDFLTFTGKLLFNFEWRLPSPQKAIGTEYILWIVEKWKKNMQKKRNKKIIQK